MVFQFQVVPNIKGYPNNCKPAVQFSSKKTKILRTTSNMANVMT